MLTWAAGCFSQGTTAPLPIRDGVTHAAGRRRRRRRRPPQIFDLDGSVTRGPPLSGGGAGRGGAGASRWMSPLMARFLAETAALQPGLAAAAAAAAAAGDGGAGGPLRVVVEVDQALYADGTLRLPSKLCVA